MTDAMLAQLAAACADVQVASAADVIAGVPARYVAAPASTAEASALLGAAAALGLTVVPRGHGRHQHWASPPSSCDLIVDTGHLNRVTEHAAGDLVVTVQAGVLLPDLQKVLAAAGQHLALDPPGADGTVGSVIATNTTGSLRFRYGAPRDLLIGITVVLADGTVAHSGGKVVKNVAGYDLGKLFAGSYGTLGLITEATFRLHPLPADSRWLTIDCPNPESAGQAVRAIAASPVAPVAVDLSWPSSDAPVSVGTLLEGDHQSTEERAARLGRELADAGAAAEPFRVARPPSGGRELAADGTLLRVAFWVGHLGRVLTTIQAAAQANGIDVATSGSAGAGVLEVSVPTESAPSAVAGFVGGLRAGLDGLSTGGVVPRVASAVVVYAPDEVRELVDVWGPVASLDLMQAVKDQFDPEHRMAPGRLAGGI